MKTRLLRAMTFLIAVVSGSLAGTPHSGSAFIGAGVQVGTTTNRVASVIATATGSYAPESAHTSYTYSGSTAAFK